MSRNFVGAKQDPKVTTLSNCQSIQTTCYLTESLPFVSRAHFWMHSISTSQPFNHSLTESLTNNTFEMSLHPNQKSLNQSTVNSPLPFWHYISVIPVDPSPPSPLNSYYPLHSLVNNTIPFNQFLSYPFVPPLVSYNSRSSFPSLISPF